MPDVSVKITVGTFSAEVTGPSEYVDKKIEELIDRFLIAGRKSLVTESKATEATPALDKEISPAEFLKKYTANNQTDRALLLGYFLERLKATSAFTPGELASLGKDVRRPFGNISDVVAQLVSRGMMMSAGDKEGKRAYSLTATGEEYVESIMQSK